ncbi:MAG TPA: hypothetical protein VG674_01450 [Amycolatopsis sp.]|nr:hypothetical protein [Amycolatopsis sp.]
MRGSSGPPPGGALSARLDGVEAAPETDAPEPPASGAFPVGGPGPQRPRRAPARRPAPPQDPHTEQFDAVAEAEPEPAGSGAPAAPPPGLAGWRKRRQREQLEDTEIGVMPVVPPGQQDVEDDYAEDYPEGDHPADSADYDGGPPTMAAEFDAGGPPTMGYPAPMPFTPGGHDDAADDDLSDLAEYEAEFDDRSYSEDPAYPDGSPDFDGADYDRADYASDNYASADYDSADYDSADSADSADYNYDYEDDYDEEAPAGVTTASEAAAEDAPASEASPGKQWLTLAGQLALGVVGGAAVWLGFNWLWVNLAPAALVGAVVVIVALVWIVRKIRRAEDLQTTLLAILVGLVVTVSPAALLLVGR